ncbi:hypothetical protein F2Q69_00035651 [Brassica cretica]|uniref:Uncharacterized protein n=1 Tax=Brassica cretica TaxID=69181 RepID=A0A8S9SN03_BRACR|nr:hypothetical protein F2Q69_00035651 [Brassica cretica]
MAAGFCEAVERMFIKASLNSNLDDLSNRLDKLSISASEAKEDIPETVCIKAKESSLKRQHSMLQVFSLPTATSFKSTQRDDLSNRLDKLSISASEAKEDIPETVCIKAKESSLKRQHSMLQVFSLPTATSFKSTQRGK